MDDSMLHELGKAYHALKNELSHRMHMSGGHFHGKVSVEVTVQAGRVTSQTAGSYFTTLASRDVDKQKTSTKNMG